MTTTTENTAPATKPELTMEEKSRQLKGYIKAADDYNLWRRMAQECMMTNLAPRAWRLGYDMQKSVGSLITNLAKCYKPCMNHFDKCEKDATDMVLNEVLFEVLCEDIVAAER